MKFDLGDLPDDFKSEIDNFILQPRILFILTICMIINLPYLLFLKLKSLWCHYVRKM